MRAIVAGLMVLAAGVFFTGIGWGLPSRAVDPYLFGNHPVWTGNEILALAPVNSDPDRGADVAGHPILNRSHPLLLNETDVQRAQIIRRYRLFTYQPDEMITLMSLSGIHPAEHDFDPRLYQYGGLWIYPVGALLKISSLLHLIDLRPDRAFYLDHPEAFGRFYVVARAYSAAWALLGVVCVFWLTQRLTQNKWASAAAALCFIFMPVVVNMAHEAKPHLPATVLMLMAIIAATRFIETGQKRWWIATGALCGLAFGMVLSAALIFIVLPITVLLRPMSGKHRLLILFASVAIGLGCYAITNPYVPINFFFHRQRLLSNLSNSTAMYHASSSTSTLLNAARRLIEATSPAIAIVGAIGGVMLLVRVVRALDKETTRDQTRATAGWLMLAPAFLITLQFILLADSKPAEYARFALFPAIVLSIAAVASIQRFLQNSRLGPGAIALLVLLTIPFGFSYHRAFHLDSRNPTSRLRAADDLNLISGSIGIYAEPAPYSCPPVNLFDRRLILLPAHGSSAANYEVEPIEGGMLDAPISWANKRFEITPVHGFVAAVKTIPAASDLRPSIPPDHPPIASAVPRLP